jgi:predicted lactoylglutathione lyase
MSLDAIGIVSEDLELSTSFYKKLGIEFKQAGAPDHLEATMPSGLRLMLDSEELIKKLNPSWEKPNASGIVLCFIQDSPEIVNKLYSIIIEAGFSSVTKPWDAFWGQRYASVKDPDGNQIDLFAKL